MTALLRRSLLAALGASAAGSAVALPSVPVPHLPTVEDRLWACLGRMEMLTIRQHGVADDDPAMVDLGARMDAVMLKAAAIRPVTDLEWALKAKLAQRYAYRDPGGAVQASILADLIARGEP